MERSHDVVVIGAGAAGLAGAVALVRARRSVLVIDAGQPRNGPAEHVHNYLGVEAASPAQLLAAGRAELVRYGGTIMVGLATAASRRHDGFAVTLATGAVVAARRLLVATGLVDELPDVPGLAERWGRDVLHCPHCHGWEVRDRRIGVLATTARGVQQAQTWRQWSPHVLLLLHGAPPPDAEQCQELAARDVVVVKGPVAEVVVTDQSLSGVRLASGEVVPLDALVVTPRFTARTGVLASLGLAPVDVRTGGDVVGSHVPADPTGATAEPGVWVAGNVTHLLAQMVTAAATGLNAAVAINADLVSDDVRAAMRASQHRSADQPDERT